MEVANAHDELNWRTYDEINLLVELHNGLFGIGFVFTDKDPFFFIDIDNCIDEKGKWNEISRYLVQHFQECGMEYSQSGRGVHIFGMSGAQTHSCKNKEFNTELYTTERFCALTNNTFGTGNAATDCTEKLAVLIDRYFPPGEETTPEDWRNVAVPEWSGPESDDDLIQRMLKSKSAATVFGNKASFSDLWANNEQALALAYPSLNAVDPYDRSSADAALAQHLAFWTGKNHARVNRLMLQSGLIRDKWSWHKKYLGMTITKAVTRQIEVYSAKTSASMEDNSINHGYENIFILPGNNCRIIDSAENIFSEIAKHRQIFIYGGLPVELETDNERYILKPVTPDGFRSRIESYGKKTMSYITHNEQILLKPKLCSKEDAKALLASRQMTDNLPPIRALLNCSVLSKELKTLGIPKFQS